MSAAENGLRQARVLGAKRWEEAEEMGRASSDGALENGFRPLNLILKAVENHYRVFSTRIGGASTKC